MNEVAYQFSIKKSTVCRISSRYPQINNMERSLSNGRPNKSIAHQNCRMLKMVKVDPREMTVDVTNYANEQLAVSIGVHTARNRLREANLFTRGSAKKQLISKVNIKIKKENSSGPKFFVNQNLTNLYMSLTIFVGS